MTPGFVEAAGRMIYVWGWPLVNYNRSLAMAGVPEPGRNGGVLPVAPLGSISMLTDYIQADQKFVTCPNQDTVYGAGYQHLDTQPVVIQVPDLGDRFFVYQIADSRTESSARSDSSTARSQVSTCWSGQIGRARHRRALMPYAEHPLTWSRSSVRAACLPGT
ncbi:DUF1254 domain-containing protein [Lysobacter sp. MMG2]|uniref:DUF1254 domain-containing protein n=1 Tax=Lysobacter sp. MMG2 TaxID=2801338 RepID=UPI001C250271|nr:DUF1254 domain-containing protein [Lysobacter sp. MMG2]MBU8975753.1 DUF1254 domain-containing protein [Lysobacter sp. MMG2]